MLNKNFTTVLCGFLLCVASSNQVIAQKYEEIQADSSYIWGIGIGTTLKAADQAALADIIGQISTQVESNFERTVTETGDKFKETVNDVVKTYSNATLNNTGRLIIEPNEPSIKVFRFIKRGEISKIFELRKFKIIELAHNGELALKNLQIADALRYFYWSQTLNFWLPGCPCKSTRSLSIFPLKWIPSRTKKTIQTIFWTSGTRMNWSAILITPIGVDRIGQTSSVVKTVLG